MADHIGICQRVAELALIGEYEAGYCAFCSEKHTPETFPFCVECASTPEQVEGATVPFIKFYRAVTERFQGKAPTAPKRRPEYQDARRIALWGAWDRFAVSIGEEPGTFGEHDLGYYVANFPTQWAKYQEEIRDA